MLPPILSKEARKHSEKQHEKLPEIMGPFLSWCM